MNNECSYLKESGRTNNNYCNENNHELQRELAYFEIYHEDDNNHTEINLNRELQWIILEHSDQLNNNLINAYLDFEL